MLAPGEPGQPRHVRLVPATSTGRRVTPTSCSTCDSCRTRITSPTLRPLTGLRPADRRLRRRDGRLKEFYDHVLPLLDYLLPQYVAEGKAHLVVAVGCTGPAPLGRDRGGPRRHFRGDGRYFVEVQHRDDGPRPIGS